MSLALEVPPRGAPVPTLTPEQAAVVERAATGTGHLVVVGVPGSGKTTVALAIAARAVAHGMDPARLLLLAPTRQAAARLRDRVAAAVDRPVGAPLVRTPAALAYSLLRDAAVAAGEPLPRLVTGAEQDVMLRELLAGHESGRVEALSWGGTVPPEATSLPGFRAELRDVLNRAAEAGLVAADLEALGARVNRPEWAAAAVVLREYEDVMALQSTPTDQGRRFDHATATAHAAQLVSGGGAPAVRELIVVDDAQDITAAAHDLLAALAQQGTRIVLVGNADEAVQGYRGAVPEALALATADRGPFALNAEVMTLGEGLRQDAALERVAAQVAQRIGTRGVASPRQPVGAIVPAQEREPLVALTASHRYGQSRAIAAQLRRARHGLDGGPQVPWSQMCVIARSAARLREIRADLAAADIPCEALGEAVALHEQPAVAPLLRILGAALGQPWTEDDVVALLGSRAVGLDPVAVRRLRRAVVARDRAADGVSTSGELLVTGMADPAWWDGVSSVEARRAQGAARAVKAARDRLALPGPTPGAVVWAAWTALGVADAWRRAALEGSARDDADLDAVIALLRAAQNYAERMPRAGVAEFVASLESQEFATDSLGARATPGDVVSFATPASAAGREWDVVVVAGLEEGAWPRLKLRDSVLGAQHLADIALGRAQAVPLDAQGRLERASSSRRQILDDETRAFVVALTRARHQVVLTAVVDEDTRASRFLALATQAAGVEVDAGGPGGLRYEVSDVRSGVAALRVMGTVTPEHAVPTLAWLAAHDVPGAHPRTWHGAQEPSTAEPMWYPEERVRVSPSKVEWIERCVLRWALESAGGTPEASDAQSVGTLIHALAEAHPDGDATAILADFDAAWAQEFGMVTWVERTAYERAREIARKLADYLAARVADEVLTEHSFQVASGNADLAGTMDRVERHGSTAYVVDIKTGGAMPSLAEALTNAQLEMYQLAIAEGAVDFTRTSSGAELAFVAMGVNGTTRTQPAVNVANARERLGRVVADMSRSSFLAIVNDSCDGCPVRRACPARPEGRQVSGA